MKITNVFAALAVLHLSACQPANDDTADIAALEAHLLEIEQLFSASYDGDRSIFEVHLDYFTDDLVLLHPEGHTTTGKVAALEFYTSAFTGVTVTSLDYYSPEILLDGDLAVRRYSGIGKGAFGEEQTEFEVTNRYVDVLQRQGNGEWLIVWHQWVSVNENRD